MGNCISRSLKRRIPIYEVHQLSWNVIQNPIQCLAGSVEGVTKTLNISDAFVGVVLLPIVRPLVVVCVLRNVLRTWMDDNWLAGSLALALVLVIHHQIIIIGMIKQYCIQNKLSDITILYDNI